ncbi:1-phosphatidylinositol-3-phosphate 5-kinase FAB1A [Thelohanellus kitauei]|uniref:1-phosphatidylinositol-3-phosphate 5-kinase FAB1A n=1 Tax=Thelohanellus kitauei TaxID=669202 RepID=A0A0C2IL91_THEKT|nr:1-phosphatidylinositol-3-phosphate 5-kinase FAB1A [Thelohanellus kitauei]
MSPERIKKSKQDISQYKREYLLKCVKRVLVIDPNIIVFGGFIPRIASQELIIRKIVVIDNINDELLRAISKSTGANIIESPEEFTFSELGTCGRFYIENITERKSLLVFDKCPFATYFSVVLYDVGESESQKLTEILRYACFTAFYVKAEYNFLRSIFPDIDYFGNKKSHPFDIRNMNCFLISLAPPSPYLPKVNRYSKIKSCEPPSIHKKSENAPTTTNFTPSKFSSNLHLMESQEISDMIMIYRATGQLLSPEDCPIEKLNQAGQEFTQTHDTNTEINEFTYKSTSFENIDFNKVKLC